MVEHGVPAAPVHNVGQVMTNPQLHHQRMVVDIPDGAGGTVRTLGCPIKTPGLPVRSTGPAPDLDEHAAEVLQQWLGLTPDEASGELETREERP